MAKSQQKWVNSLVTTCNIKVNHALVHATSLKEKVVAEYNYSQCLNKVKQVVQLGKHRGLQNSNTKNDINNRN